MFSAPTSLKTAPVGSPTDRGGPTNGLIFFFLFFFFSGFPKRNHAKGLGVSGSFESNGSGVPASSKGRRHSFERARGQLIGRFFPPPFSLDGGQPTSPNKAAPGGLWSWAFSFSTRNGGTVAQLRLSMDQTVPHFPPCFPGAGTPGDCFFYLRSALSRSQADSRDAGKPDPALM